MTIKNKQRLEFLLLRYMEDKIKMAERQELDAFMLDEQEEDAVLELMEELLATEKELKNYSENDWEPTLSDLLQKKQKLKKEPGVIRPMQRWKSWVVAASVILLAGLGYLIWQPAIVEKPLAEQKVDVKPPQTNRAIIAFANGQQIYLDSVVNGTLVQQAGVELVKLADGKIIYKGSTTEILYNTLSNPRGSKVIDMTLSDGSRVWLNAGSSVTYPIAFVGNERKVSVTGEAYFEVAHDKTKPFIVSNGTMHVQVLGTHFNVKAYDDEADIKVTLLEGSVKVNEVIIKPGEQAAVSNEVKIITDVDLEEVMAWKNGQFRFGVATDLGIIIKEIARWYDVQFVFEGSTQHQQFGGEIPRSSNLSEVLEILKTSGVKFSLVNRVITIKP